MRGGAPDNGGPASGHGGAQDLNAFFCLGQGQQPGAPKDLAAPPAMAMTPKRPSGMSMMLQRTGRVMVPRLPLPCPPPARPGGTRQCDRRVRVA